MGTWCETVQADGDTVLFVRGAWRLAEISSILPELRRQPVTGVRRLIVDGSQLSTIDTTCAMALLKSLATQGWVPEDRSLRNFSASHLSIISLTRESLRPPLPLKNRARFGFIGELGQAASAAARTFGSILNFVGTTTLELLRALALPFLLRFKELFVQLELCGLDAIPIVCLVTFLIGVVTAYLGGVQTEWYGANIFIVDGISLSMCRELSPILVAIIVAGRSGSAFTAQIGAMKLNEEIDALVTLGLSPMRVLVVPRMLALMLTMPLLVFFGDVAGILGGMLIADWRFGLSAPTFIERLRTVLWVRSVLVGLFKAPVFGLFIATIGCRMGLIVENNARSLGLNTTATVVRSIVAVILLNAAFAVVFTELGI